MLTDVKNCMLIAGVLHKVSQSINTILLCDKKFEIIIWLLLSGY